MFTYINISAHIFGALSYFTTNWLWLIYKSFLLISVNNQIALQNCSTPYVCVLCSTKNICTNNVY